MALAQRIEQSPSTLPPNGKPAPKALQETFHLPDKLPIWYQLREYLWKGWDPVVINKHVDSVTMPKWIASAILVAVLGFGAASWWRNESQREILIEMRTELRLVKEAKVAEDAEERRRAGDMQAWREVMNGQLREIKGMLSQQQLNALERLQKSGQNTQQ